MIVVNDGSADGSRATLDALAIDRPWLRVIHHETNGGYGKALLSGFAAARHEWIFYTDGDAQYDASEAALLVPLATDDIDVVQGYKIGRGDSWYRKLIGRFYHHVVKLLFNLKVRDTDCDFRMFRRQLIIDRPLTSTTGVICVEMMRSFHRAGARFVEIPCTSLLPPVRQVAVLPTAGHRPQRPPTAGTVVEHGDPWTLRPACGAVSPGQAPTTARAGPSGRCLSVRWSSCTWSGATNGSSATTGRSSSREKVHQVSGLDDMLFMAQDGHWMTIPIIVYRVIHAIFGTGSYWPYLIPTMACHLGIVAMVRKLSLRVGVTPWTATILAGTLAVFGSGWENIVFAIQLVYNLSLLAFLVHLSLIDHDGPPNRRDAAGVIAGLVAVSSSGFGPFFIVGTLLFIVLRRRWKAAAIATIPTALASAWWWLFWGQDPAGGSSRSLSQMPPYVNRGLEAVFQGMTSTASLVGISLIGTLAVLLWRQRDAAAHDLMLSLAITATLIYVGLGIQRGGFGVETAANSRYVYIGAALLIPAFGVAVDQLARIASPAVWAGRLLLIGATAMNISALRSNGNDWANRANAERNVLELIAASPALSTVERRGTRRLSV